MAKSVAPRAIGSRFIPWHEHCGFFPQDEVCRIKGLSSGAKLLYMVLVRFAGKDGVCFPSRERLAEDLALDARQITRLLGKLKKAGLIEHERGREGRSNRYHFLWHPRFASKSAPVPDEANRDIRVPRKGADMLPASDVPVPHQVADVSPSRDIHVPHRETDTSERGGHPCPTNDRYNYTGKYSGNYSGREDEVKKLSLLVGMISDNYRESPLVKSSPKGASLCENILDELYDFPAGEFVEFVLRRFKSGKSPSDEQGLREWSELTRWGMEFVDEKLGRRLPEKAA